MNPPSPLCVDLDGTLLATDCLWESFVQGVRQRPFTLFLVTFWLLKGRAGFKRRLADQVDFEVEDLPENVRFVIWLREEYAKGRELYLVSASDQTLVTAVSDKFGIFKEAIGSREGLNLKGENKAAYLVERFGEKGFDYAGNDVPDLKVWKHSNRAILVHPGSGLLDQVPEAKRVVIFEDRSTVARAFLKALRPERWTKNLLIFFPLLITQSWQRSEAWMAAVLAFLALSLTASAGYLINDLADLRSDRQHPSKRNRPLASGALPLYVSFTTLPVLLVVAVWIMAIGNPSGVLILGGYFVTSCLYSFWLKRIVKVQFFVLVGFYCLRLVLGMQILR